MKGRKRRRRKREGVTVSAQHHSLAGLLLIKEPSQLQSCLRCCSRHRVDSASRARVCRCLSLSLVPEVWSMCQGEFIPLSFPEVRERERILTPLCDKLLRRCSLPVWGLSCCLCVRVRESKAAAAERICTLVSPRDSCGNLFQVLLSPSLLIP